MFDYHGMYALEYNLFMLITLVLKNYEFCLI